MFTNVKTSLNLAISAYNLHKTDYFSSWRWLSAWTLLHSHGAVNRAPRRQTTDVWHRPSGECFKLCQCPESWPGLDIYTQDEKGKLEIVFLMQGVHFIPYYTFNNWWQVSARPIPVSRPPRVQKLFTCFLKEDQDGNWREFWEWLLINHGIPKILNFSLFDTN